METGHGTYMAAVQWFAIVKAIREMCRLTLLNYSLIRRFIERYRGRDRSVERGDATALSQPRRRAERAPDRAAHAFALRAEHQEGRGGQVELAQRAVGLRLEPDDLDTRRACFVEGARQRRHSTQPRMLDRPGR